LTSSQWKRLIIAYAEALNTVAERLRVQGIDVEVRRQEFAESAEDFFEQLNVSGG